MAFKHGKVAEVTVNSVNLSAFCDSADLSISKENADTTVFGLNWRTNIGGLIGAKYTLSGNFDPTTTTGPASALATALLVDTGVPVIYEPGGAASNQSRTFSANVSGYNESSPVGGKVTFSCDLEVTGAVTFES